MLKANVQAVLAIPCLATFLQELFRLRNGDFWDAIEAQRKDPSILASKDRTKQDRIVKGDW